VSDVRLAPAGTRTIRVRLLAVDRAGDTLAEGEESFFLQLASPRNAGFSRPLGEVTIEDDESYLTIQDVWVTEGDPDGSGTTTKAVFTISLSSALPLPVDVSYTTAEVADGNAATAGVDYQTVSGHATIEPGQTWAKVTVPVIPDLEEESEERFLLRLVDSNTRRSRTLKASRRSGTTTPGCRSKTPS